MCGTTVVAESKPGRRKVHCGHRCRNAAWLRRSAGSRANATVSYFLAVANGTETSPVFTAEDASRYAEGLLELTGDRIG